MIVSNILLMMLSMAANDGVPSARTISRIESGSLLLEQLRAVGVADTTSMNRQARVRVRKVVCIAGTANRATCTYEADHCRDGKINGEDNGWCPRRTQFVRRDRPLPSEASDHGWVVDGTRTDG